MKACIVRTSLGVRTHQIQWTGWKKQSPNSLSYNVLVSRDDLTFEMKYIFFKLCAKSFFPLRFTQNGTKWVLLQSQLVRTSSVFWLLQTDRKHSNGFPRAIKVSLLSQITMSISANSWPLAQIFDSWFTSSFVFAHQLSAGRSYF